MLGAANDRHRLWVGRPATTAEGDAPCDAAEVQPTFGFPHGVVMQGLVQGDNFHNFARRHRTLTPHGAPAPSKGQCCGWRSIGIAGGASLAVFMPCYQWSVRSVGTPAGSFRARIMAGAVASQCRNACPASVAISPRRFGAAASESQATASPQ